MRITNSMMVNNSLYNINNNKIQTDKLNTQLATEKKIQRPSDDPIVAVRALRLRSTYNEVCQYLEKNVPDARSVLECTDDALESINDVLEDIITYCNQGVNDYNTVSEREAFKTTLIQLRKQVFSYGDADLNGRTLFTGYKTDTTLTFQEDDKNIKYQINQSFKADDVDNMNRIVGISVNNIAMADQRAVTNETFHVIKLAYDGTDTLNSLKLTNADGSVSEITPIVRSKEVFDAAGNSVYQRFTSGAVFVPETGEILISDAIYQSLSNGGTLDATYEKTGFDKGDLRPEHYFDCTKNIYDLATKSYNESIDYKSENQEIFYTINFNQTLKVNTQAKDVLKHDMIRDLDEMIYAVEAALTAQTKIDKINNQLASATNDNDKTMLNSMLTAANLELSYANENMGKVFSKNIGNYQGHQQVLNNELSDIGARMVRLNLNEERLSAQKLSVKELKSSNEEVDVTQVAVEFKAASAVYDASLAAAAKVVQNTLLDFL